MEGILIDFAIDFFLKNKIIYFQMLSFVEHLTGDRFFIGLTCANIAPYNIETFVSVINFLS